MGAAEGGSVEAAGMHAAERGAKVQARDLQGVREPASAEREEASCGSPQDPRHNIMASPVALAGRRKRALQRENPVTPLKAPSLRAVALAATTVVREPQRAKRKQPMRDETQDEGDTRTGGMRGLGSAGSGGGSEPARGSRPAQGRAPVDSPADPAHGESPDSPPQMRTRRWRLNPARTAAAAATAPAAVRAGLAAPSPGLDASAATASLHPCEGAAPKAKRASAQSRWRGAAKATRGPGKSLSAPASGGPSLLCRGCGAPGAQRRSASKGGALCRSCLGRWNDREYCPVCERLWSDQGDDASMLQCDRCEVWVHARCEAIPPAAVAQWGELAYSCPECRGKPPGKGLAQPARRPVTAACFSCASCSVLRPVRVPQHGGVSLCAPCEARWDRREFCPVCAALWREAQGDDDDDDDALEEMVQCDGCELWVHAACDKVSPAQLVSLESRAYFCPACRGPPSGAGVGLDDATLLEAGPVICASSAAVAGAILHPPGVASGTAEPRPVRPRARKLGGSAFTTVLGHALSMPELCASDLTVGPTHLPRSMPDAPPRPTAAGSTASAAGAVTEVFHRAAEAVSRYGWQTGPSGPWHAMPEASVSHPHLTTFMPDGSHPQVWLPWQLPEFPPTQSGPPAAWPHAQPGGCWQCAGTPPPMFQPHLAQVSCPPPPFGLWAGAASVEAPYWPMPCAWARPVTFTVASAAPPFDCRAGGVPPQPPYAVVASAVVGEAAGARSTSASSTVLASVAAGGTAPLPVLESLRNWLYDPSVAARYASHAEGFEPLTASNVAIKMRRLCDGLATVYGSIPFARKEWGTSILGTLVGLICAQTCRNSWSSIGYSNMQATFPGPNGEPDWDRVRRSRVQDVEVCIRHGPYFHRKAERIHALLQKAYDDFGEGTSFEALNAWPSDKARAHPPPASSWLW